MTVLGSRRINSYWVLVLPLLLLLVALYVYPVARVLIVSVTDPTVGFSNYELLATNSGIQKMLWVTLRVCVVTSVITMLLGYIVAYVLVHVGERHRLWMMLFILIPFWVSVLIPVILVADPVAPGRPGERCPCWLRRRRRTA